MKELADFKKIYLRRISKFVQLSICTWIFQVGKCFHRFFNLFQSNANKCLKSIERICRCRLYLGKLQSYTLIHIHGFELLHFSSQNKLISWQNIWRVLSRKLKSYFFRIIGCGCLQKIWKNCTKFRVSSFNPSCRRRKCHISDFFSLKLRENFRW